MTWVRHANKLEKENTKLAGLLEEALDCIDQYDYEEAFDLVQRIKDAINHTRMGHPPVIPWSGSGLTEKEELLQKVQQLERDKVKMLADLQVESEINAKGGEREYVLLGKVEQLQRENAALRADAERYRWIKRDSIGVYDVLELFVAYTNCDLDKEIDAARAKEAKTCQCTNGVVRSVGRDNEEIIEDCPNCSPSKEAKP